MPQVVADHLIGRRQRYRRVLLGNLFGCYAIEEGRNDRFQRNSSSLYSDHSVFARDQRDGFDCERFSHLFQNTPRSQDPLVGVASRVCVIEVKNGF